METDRLKILNKVKAGEISIEEGSRLLGSIEGDSQRSADVASSTGPVVQEASPEDLSEAGLTRYRNWWLYPLWIGLGLLVFSSGLMSWAYSSRTFFWFYCSWLPLLLSLLVIVLAAWSRQARWLHLRVDEQSETKSSHIKLSFPIPTGLAAWFFRTFGASIPALKEKGIPESVLPLLDTLGNSREPMVVEVNEKDGQKVQVYII